MEWSKLKNIIILILLLANLFLLVMAGVRQRDSAQHQEQALNDAVSVLERSGIRMDRGRLPSELDLTPMTVERDQAAEAELAGALLGDCSAADLGSGRFSYTGVLGTAEFRSNGNFSFSFPDGALRVGVSGEEAHALDTLEKIGFDGEVISREEEGGGVLLVLRQVWQGTPVLSCQVTLTYERDCLRSISGQRLMGAPQPSADRSELLSVPTALLRFLNGVTSLGDVCSEITAMTPAYLLTTDATRLVPIWYVTTDVGVYSLNAVTGALGRA